jgi:hypothetical protein
MKTATVQNNFLSGVLDERAAGRVETDAYNNGMLVGRNIVPIHLGGVRRRGGFRHIVRLPNKLTRVEDGITVTAPNGGTTANANDDDSSTAVTTTNNVSTTNPYVVLHYDLGSQKTFTFVDVLGIRSSGGSSTEFTVQTSTDNVSWSGFAAPGDLAANSLELVDPTPRNYRRGGGFSGTGTVTARYLRLVKQTGTDMGAVTITLTGMNVWQESSTISEVATVPFEISADEEYMVALTDRTASVFEGDVFLLSVPTPYEDTDLAEIDADADAETMVLTHQDYPQQFLLRESPTNFQMEDIEFQYVPQWDFADSDSPTPTSDVQVITFAVGWAPSDVFQLELDGARSGSISFAGDATADQQNATAANIARAVQKLYTVLGFTGVTCARTGALQYTVTLAGASAGAYGLMSGIGLSAFAAAGITVAHSATGVSRHEDAWSETRGYPRTVAFFGGRVYFGGTRSLPQTLFGSRVNNILDFDLGQGLSDEAIEETLSGAKLSAINALFGGRALQVFTTGAEFVFLKARGEAIVPGDKPTLQTHYGAKRIRPVTIDGSTDFVQRTGKSVRDFRYNYEEEAFDSLGLSSLAPELLNDVAGLAAWNGSRQDEISLVFAVNGDGTAAVYNSRKEAQVQAWVSWDTEGEFKAVTSVFQDVYFATARTINGVEGLYVEMVDDDYYNDCSIQTTSFSDLGDGTTLCGVGTQDFLPLAGQTVRVRADGFHLEDAVVSEFGTIIIAYEDPALVEVGLPFDPEVTPMPLSTMTPKGPNFMDKRRVVSVTVKVRNTLGLLCNGRVVTDRKLDLNNFDTPMTPVSGNFKLSETTGWDIKDDKTVTFTQEGPHPFEILAIKVELGSH